MRIVGVDWWTILSGFVCTTRLRSAFEKAGIVADIGLIVLALCNTGCYPSISPLITFLPLRNRLRWLFPRPAFTWLPIRIHAHTAGPCAVVAKELRRALRLTGDSLL